MQNIIKFASPTFLFREQCHQNLKQIMNSLSNIGFNGLELYGMFGLKSDVILDFCRESGLEITCDHIHYEEFSQNTLQSIKDRTLLGAKFLTIDNIPSNLLPGTASFSEAIHEIERISRVCRDYGVQLLYHNHGYDLMQKVNGIPILEIILDNIDPELLKFQPDLGWIRLGGGDPNYYLEKYKTRCPIIHLKDYFVTAPILLESPFLLGNNRGGLDYNFFEFRPSGFGIMNYPSLMPKILECNPLWITTDHDLSYERDTYEDMKIGLDYTKYLVSIQFDGKQMDNDISQ